MGDRLQREGWWQIAYGFIAMMAISSPQHVLMLFVAPIGKVVGGSLAALQITF